MNSNKKLHRDISEHVEDNDRLRDKISELCCINGMSIASDQKMKEVGSDIREALNNMHTLILKLMA
jgi:hypothetical protein